MQRYALNAQYSVKNGISQEIYRFFRFFISKSLVFMGFYGPSIVCCLYTKFGVFKISLQQMKGYALVMRYAWKINFLKKNIKFSGDFHI